jgi:AP2-associated kinase
VQETEIIPEIAPMRRGRPGRPHSSQPSSSRPSPSPYRDNAASSSHDPFAVLDGDASRKKTAEEVAKRFPSLDQFDILHEQGDKFEFEPTVEPKSEDEDLSKRLTNALADDAFARRASPERAPKPVYKRPSQASPVRAPVVREAPRQATPLYQPTPQRPAMVSTGTMTSPAQTPRLPEAKITNRPIYRFPSSDNEQRSSSQPWTAEEEQRASRPRKEPSPPMSSLKPEGSPRVSSDRLSTHSSSARPSMETLRRPSTLEITDSAARSRSAVGKGRPLSVQSGPRYDITRDIESPRSSLDMSRMQYEGGAPLRSVRTEVDRESDRANISSDVDYLRAKEEEESNRKREKRSSGSHKHNKRGSLSNLSLSGGKNLFAGRFGDAFRRFEAGNQDKPSTPSAEDAPQQGLIGASDSADEGLSPNDEIALEDADRDDISPEMRRELERRRLSQEEKRVANAAAEYRRRVAEKGDGGGRAVGEGPRSRTIQSKVQSLLGESDKPVIPKTATGYGRFTETSSSLQAKQSEIQPDPSRQMPTSRAPGPVYSTRESSMTPLDRRDGTSAPAGLQQSEPSTTYQSTQRPATRPAAPPKPKNLRVGGDISRPGTGNDNRPSSQVAPQSPGEDWEANFSKRFPSLSGIEMETEIEIPKFPSLRTREV